MTFPHTRVPAPHARVFRSSAFGRGRTAGTGHVLGQDLFLDALVRERERADRFEEPFVLVLISFNDQSTHRWEVLLEALSQAVDADMIGWLEHGSVLGVVRSLTAGDLRETATALAWVVRHELERCLTPAGVDSCSIRLDIYSPQNKSTVLDLLHGREERDRRRDALSAVAKRILDVVGSTAFLIAFSPVFLVVSALVKLTSKGPAFFRQERLGEAGRPFLMLKFRTMRVNVDDRIHQQYMAQFIQSSNEAAAGKSVVFKMVNDPRVTPIGRFLRRSSLDEFPQFWNVLKGEMSLVGPRPPLAYEVARYKPWHRRRVLEAKPGITGLWQVTGRSRTTFDEMVRLDIRYARNHSMWTDLKILLATPWAILSGTGAH